MIEGTQDLDTDIPAGVTTVNVTMTEFTFDFDKTRVADGNFALKLQNNGRQPHQAILLRLPEGVSARQALDAPSYPEGVQFIAFQGPVAPGQSMNLVLSSRLDPDRYMLVCFLPDTANPSTTHDQQGMYTEFTVQP